MFCWLLESYLCLLFCFLLGLLSRYKTKKSSPEDIYEISLSWWKIIGGSKTPCLKGSILRNEWQSKSEFEGQQGPRDRYLSQVKIIYNMPTCRKHSSFTLNQRIHNSQKLYEYRECGKPFSCGSNFVQHEEIHSGDKLLIVKNVGIPLIVSIGSSLAVR